MATVWAFFLSLVAMVGSFIGWVFLNMQKLYKKENIERAQKFYEEGEAHFAKKNYKDAKWNYALVSEFYGKPHTNWLDLSVEKEWICRAYLNEWAPSKGPSYEDIRLTQPKLYAKYKPTLDQVTPVMPVKKPKKKNDRRRK